MGTKANAQIEQYHILDTEWGPTISDSRMTVFDVLEEQNYGKSVEEISRDRNLHPDQVRVALAYIDTDRERFQTQLKEIIRRADERRRKAKAEYAEIRARIDALPMTPERAKLRAIIAKNRARRAATDASHSE